MRYWNEMDDKHGFDDGAALPDGVEQYRDVYTKAVNALAAKRGSKIRVVPFDRSGVHNPVLWIFVPKDWFEKTFLPKQKNGMWQGIGLDDLAYPLTEDSDSDRAMKNAIDEAMEADLDQYIVVEAKISDSFEDFLKEVT